MADLLISIVSHRQGELVGRLLRDLKHVSPPLEAEIVVTLNVDEAAPDPKEHGLPVRLIRNRSPRGFAANHNAAFRSARSRWFCVLNPDLRLAANPFPLLLSLLSIPGHALVAPAVVNASGMIEDSARKMPTPRSILWKALTGRAPIDYELRDELVYPDWVAGMFMLFDSGAFAENRGFDERYFLYYEDVDLCCRLRLSGRRIVLDPRVRVVHDARRASHRDLRYLRWHLSSMLRFFNSPIYRLALEQVPVAGEKAR